MRSLSLSVTGHVFRLLASCTLVLALQSAGLAQNGTWTNLAGGDYSTPSNWSGNQVAMGAGNTANFSTLDITSDVSVTLNTPLTIGSLLFGDTNTATGGSWELRTDDLAGAILTLDNGAAKPNITVNPLVPATTFDDAFLGHSLAGTMGFIKSGAGVLTLGPGTTNTITGGIDLSAGTLRINAAIPGQPINIADGATLETAVSLDANIAPGAGALTINVEPGATANITTTATVELGNFDADGATLNINLAAAGSTLSADGNWAINGSPAAVNVSSTAGGTFRLRPNSGSPNFNTVTAFANTHLTLDNVTMFTRTNSGGNDVNIGALSGTASAVLAGGGQGGGTAARYIIGSLNQDSEFAGTIDSGAGPTPIGGINLIKVGTAKLTLSGTIMNPPQVVGTSAATDPTRRGGVTQIQAGTLALTNSATLSGGIVDATAGTVFSTVDVQADGTLDVTGYTGGTYATQPLQQIVGTGNIVGNWNHADGFIRPGNTLTNFSANTNAVAGQIDFNGNLSLSGGSIGYDMTIDPNSGNDLVHVTGTTNVSGGTIVPNFFSGIPSSGTYTVLTSDGGITGNIGALTVDFPGRGADPVPFIDGNSIKFSAVSGGGSANLIWTGANGGIWDVESTQAWTNGGSPDVFFNLDSVTFNNAPTSATVMVTQVVSPTAIVIDNPTTDYVFMASGSGSISGTTGLTKTGAGNLTMQMGNTYSGPTMLQGGTIDIGTSGSPFGTGPLSISGVTVLGIAGAGFGNSSLMTAEATTNVIQIDGNSGSGGTFGIPTLSGDGTLTITSTLADKWFALNGTAGFSGTLNLTGLDGQTVNTVRLTTAGGGTSFPNAIVNLNDVSLANRQGAGAGTVAMFEFGELHGDEQSVLNAFLGGSAAVDANWVIGGLNTDSDFAGTIIDGAGSNMSVSSSHVTKVGTGKLTLSGANTYTGNTTVEAGTLSITTPFLADAADVLVAAGAILDLNFGGDDIIDSLYLAGMPVTPGIWGSAASGAANTSPLFTGMGRLSVTTLGEQLGIAGDYNNNGVVDAADYVLWRNGGPLENDPTPGVQPEDYNTWRANFGLTAGAGSTASIGNGAVPEPAAWLLAMFALIAWGARHRQ